MEKLKPESENEHVEMVQFSHQVKKEEFMKAFRSRFPEGIIEHTNDDPILGNAFSLVVKPEQEKELNRFILEFSS